MSQRPNLFKGEITIDTWLTIRDFTGIDSSPYFYVFPSNCDFHIIESDSSRLSLADLLVSAPKNTTSLTNS